MNEGLINTFNIGTNVYDVDSYKFSHWNFYLPDLERVYSYFECRKGARFPKQVFFGLQYILNQLNKKITSEEIEEAYEMTQMHGVPMNKEGFKYLDDKYGGYLPVTIRAVPEGLVLPISNALITIENNDPKCAWLTNFLETQLSRVWYPITVATLSYYCKQLMKNYLEQTADSDGILNFQLHDFGSRGVTCREQAGIGGMAHLVNFMGTDTVIALKYAEKFYNAPKACGYSVNATEHSIMTALGEAGETELFKHILDQCPKGILSVVIDSYNYKNFISGIANSFKDQILARDGKVVFRPDSGDPVSTSLDVFNRLAEVFGYTINSKGYKVLNPKVGMLWGDGIDYIGIGDILENFKRNKISTENIVFGCGAGLLQRINRDTMRCAFKCSAQQRNNVWYDICKNPLDYTKASKKGKLQVYNFKGNYETQKVDNLINDSYEEMLQPVFKNGEILKTYTFDEVRKLAALS